MAHAKHIKGDRAELIAAEYFMSIGYSVHRNMSGHGPVDMVLIDEDSMGDVILVDVKALSLRTKNGWKVNRVPTKKQQELDVQLIFVNLDTREVYDAMPKKKDKQVKTDTKNVVDIKEYMRTHMPE
jgi:Holliday junction resolvase-like predicted endonuclease